MNFIFIFVRFQIANVFEHKRADSWALIKIDVTGLHLIFTGGPYFIKKRSYSEFRTDKYKEEFKKYFYLKEHNINSDSISDILHPGTYFLPSELYPFIKENIIPKAEKSIINFNAYYKKPLKKFKEEYLKKV